MSAGKLLSASDFDQRRTELEARLHDWHARECIPFDDAVRAASAAEVTEDDLSIWSDMPAIDSKLAISALLEIEAVTTLEIPATFIRSGGYETLQDLIDDLFPKVRAQCYEPTSMIQPTSARISSPQPIADIQATA